MRKEPPLQFWTFGKKNARIQKNVQHHRIATLERRTWLSENRNSVAVVFGLLLGLGALASKVMTVMANTSGAASRIPMSMNRLRLRIVQALEEDDASRSQAGERRLHALSESVRILCEGVQAHPMGFRLSGFIVTPKIVVQVIYGSASLLLLVLARGRTSV